MRGGGGFTGQQTLSFLFFSKRIVFTIYFPAVWIFGTSIKDLKEPCKSYYASQELYQLAPTGPF